MTERSSNGKVSLALLKQEHEQVKAEVEITRRMLDEVREFIHIQNTINSDVKCQLWENGRSRIQTIEQCASSALLLTKLVLVPVGLLVVIEVFKGISTLIR